MGPLGLRFRFRSRQQVDSLLDVLQLLLCRVRQCMRQRSDGSVHGSYAKLVHLQDNLFSEDPDYFRERRSHIVPRGVCWGYLHQDTGRQMHLIACIRKYSLRYFFRRIQDSFQEHHCELSKPAYVVAHKNLPRQTIPIQAIRLDTLCHSVCYCC